MYKLGGLKECKDRILAHLYDFALQMLIINKYLVGCILVYACRDVFVQFVSL